MGFFSRLSNIISSKANKALDKMEDPIEQIDLAIRKREEVVSNAKRESASFIGSLSQKNKEIKALKEKIAQYEEGIRKALAEGDEAKAKTFLVKKKEMDQEAVTMESTAASLEKTAKQVTDNINALEKEIKELKVKKNELAARYSTAKAQAKVNEMLGDLNKDVNISISDIEERVVAAENYAVGLDSFKEENLDDELSKYLNSSQNSDLDSELDKYRQ